MARYKFIYLFIYWYYACMVHNSVQILRLSWWFWFRRGRINVVNTTEFYYRVQWLILTTANKVKIYTFDPGGISVSMRSPLRPLAQTITVRWNVMLICDWSIAHGHPLLFAHGINRWKAPTCDRLQVKIETTSSPLVCTYSAVRIFRASTCGWIQNAHIRKINTQ